MLQVMLYEYVFLITMILGLALGHFITSRLARSYNRRAQAAGVEVTKLPAEAVILSSGTPCCATDTTV